MQLDKRVPHELRENGNIVVMKSVLRLFRATTAIHFSIALGHAIKNGFYKAIGSAQHIGWTPAKLHYTSQRKTMVTVWYSSAGMIHFNFLNSGETIAADKYYQEIDEMNRKLQHMRPALVNKKGSIFLHNSRPHFAQMTLQKLIK
ncbi:Histone-lysine N-methyltransferase SETMAR [Araneus ventricosus]|uniref:Histone-lysine N-methyltransferase SETMAR n=1 Tax=Araneus ventricosus TaxID=182803 RepID=A0A4Y2BQZ8_ARAVE|nr:Histone-lysine N-methyltransferase SETMAR [Araneus ventricosus]